MATDALSLHKKSTDRDRRAEHVILWVLQGTLAAIFFFLGTLKYALPARELHALIPWTLAVPVWFVRFIAFIELCGAVGLVVPAALRVVPVLTPAAAVGLVVGQWLALAFHLGRGEWAMIPVNVSLGLACAIVGWGRSRYLPISTLPPEPPPAVHGEGRVPPGIA